MKILYIDESEFKKLTEREKIRLMLKKKAKRISTKKSLFEVQNEKKQSIQI